MPDHASKSRFIIPGVKGFNEEDANWISGGATSFVHVPYLLRLTQRPIPLQGNLLASLTPRPPSAGPKVASEAAPKDGSQTLWLLEGGQPRALRVTVLGSNGQVSEVRPVEADSPLAPGAEVIVEAITAKP